MKKIVRFLFILTLLLSIHISVYAADPAIHTLEKAQISITSDGSTNYDILQTISLSGEGDLNGLQIEHTLSKINQISPENLVFVSDGNELDYVTEEEESLVRYFVIIPQGYSDTFNYEISYALTLEEGTFTTPLFVPMHPAAGKSNVVQIEFQTTEENIVQRNSFPVLKKSVDNQVTSYLMNVPSHVNYIFGPEKNIFNAHNIVSWTAILILLSIIIIWIRSELNNNRFKSPINNDKGVVN